MWQPFKGNTQQNCGSIAIKTLQTANELSEAVICKAELLNRVSIKTTELSICT
jgi:hypothetical protein